MRAREQQLFYGACTLLLYCATKNESSAKENMRNNAGPAQHCCFFWTVQLSAFGLVLAFVLA